MFLVVGLGNPGKAYASHRHNVGFMVVDEVARALGDVSFRDKFSAEMGRGTTKQGEDVVLLKPQTYMNLSGDSVQPAAAFFKIPKENVLVVHDELDVPFAELRLKVGGGHAGHNGIRSIIDRLASPDFARLRIGVGRPPPTFAGSPADFVLSGFSTEEREKLPDILRRAKNSVLDVLARGVTPAMNALNTRSK